MEIRNRKTRQNTQKRPKTMPFLGPGGRSSTQFLYDIRVYTNVSVTVRSVYIYTLCLCGGWHKNTHTHVSSYFCVCLVSTFLFTCRKNKGKSTKRLTWHKPDKIKKGLRYNISYYHIKLDGYMYEWMCGYSR